MKIFLLQASDDSNIFTTIFVFIVFVGPIIASLVYLFVNSSKFAKHDKLFEKGIFPADLEFNRDNLMEAYILLAGLLLARDKNQFGEKVIYIKKYFSTYFPNSGVFIGKSLSFALKHPIKVHTVGKWLHKNLNKEKDCLQIMYFLVGIAKLDGFINPRELHVLDQLSKLLTISPTDFNRIIAVPIDEERNQQSRSSNRSRSNYKPNKTTKKLACEVLDLPESATMTEIKSAYRKLVKIHHPDRFHNESKAKQEAAEVKFLKIQKAYETLEKL